MRRIFQIVLCLMLGAIPAAAETTAGRRVALVMGNSNYANAPRLPNAVADARAMQEQLQKLGYKVIAGFDLDLRGLWRKLREFGPEAADADAAVLYYAGHGMQINGRSFLIAVDADPIGERDNLGGGIDIEQALGEVRSRVGVNVVLLDACRDIPIQSRRSATRSVQVMRGLGRLEATNQTYIAFATEPGDVASDGDGMHSPFTQALLDHIGSPGLDIDLMMREVKADVQVRTARKQVPWTSNSLTRHFSINPHPKADGEANNVRLKYVATAEQRCGEMYVDVLVARDKIEASRNYLRLCTDSSKASEVTQLLRQSIDNRNCERALSEGTISALRDYLAAHPDGACLPQVKSRLAGTPFKLAEAAPPPAPVRKFDQRFKCTPETGLAFVRDNGIFGLSDLNAEALSDFVDSKAPGGTAARKSRAELIEETRKFRSRWASRTYEPESTSVRASADRCELQMEFRFSLQDATLQIRGRRSARFTIDLQGPQPRLVAQSVEPIGTDSHLNLGRPRRN